jgi:hypothetical protein
MDWSTRLSCSLTASRDDPDASELHRDVESVAREFNTGGYDHLWINIRGSGSLPDLAFLDQVEGLRKLYVQGRVRDDTYAFRIAGLQELRLLTRCRKPLPDVDLNGFTWLAIDNRPGIGLVHDLPELERLTIFNWPGPSFEFLGEMPKLRYLGIEGRTRISMAGLISLKGLERCPKLWLMDLTRCRVDSLEPLRGLPLAEIVIVGDHRCMDSVVLDLDPLSGMTNLQTLRLTYAGAVTSLRPLLSLRELTWLALGGTQVVDDDLTPLAVLAERARALGGSVHGPND